MKEYLRFSTSNPSNFSSSVGRKNASSGNSCRRTGRVWDLPQKLTRHRTELEVRALEWNTFHANQRSGDTGDLRPSDNRIKYQPLRGRKASSRTGCTKKHQWCGTDLWLQRRTSHEFAPQKVKKLRTKAEPLRD